MREGERELGSGAPPVRRREMSEKKSSFSVTCSRLSQFLKEKRSFAHLALLQNAPNNGLFRATATMSLLPGVDVSADTKYETAETGSASDGNGTKSMDLFPQQTGFCAADQNTDTKQEEKAHQLTIFFGGKVMVFDNFPADKANDLMELAAKGSSPAAPPAAPALPVRCPAATGSQQAPAQPNPDLSMTIARRTSIHRFFEKRKDRITSKAPYQVSSSPSSSGGEPGKPKEPRAWLGLDSEASNPSTSSENKSIGKC